MKDVLDCPNTVLLLLKPLRFYCAFFFMITLSFANLLTTEYDSLFPNLPKFQESHF